MVTNDTSSKSALSTRKEITPSTQAEMDQALTLLSAHKDAWAKMDIPGRNLPMIDQNCGGTRLQTFKDELT